MSLLIELIRLALSLSYSQKKDKYMYMHDWYMTIRQINREALNLVSVQRL